MIAQERKAVKGIFYIYWADLGVTGRQPVRDLWLHKNVGAFDGSYAVEVPAHGTVLLKVGTPRP